MVDLIRNWPQAASAIARPVIILILLSLTILRTAVAVLKKHLTLLVNSNFKNDLNAAPLHCAAAGAGCRGSAPRLAVPQQVVEPVGGHPSRLQQLLFARL